MPIIELENGKVIRAKEGEELSQLSERVDLSPLKFGCKRGNCGVCAVEVTEGNDHLSKKSTEETMTLRAKGILSKNARLACQCAINGNIRLQKVSPSPFD